MDWKSLLDRRQQQPMPPRMAPMLATLTTAPFDNEDWTFEIKWDGYRILSYTHLNQTNLYSRSLLNYTSKYKLIAEELSKFEHNMLLDGEVVLLDEDGRPDFDALQRYDGKNGIVFYVFDCLWLNGRALFTYLFMKEKKY